MKKFDEPKVFDPEKVKAGKEKRRTEPTRYERFAWFAPVEDELSQQADAEQNAEFVRIPEDELPIEGEAAQLPELDPNEQPVAPLFTEEDAKLLRSSAPQNPDSLFATMMDVGKPAQYAYDDRRYRSADRLGRSVSPFLDSAVAQGIYKDADARRQQYMQRAREGEENVLQRRTTAENMWGHYSPAITQSLTNAGIFMQRAFQAREEGDKLMEAKRANDVLIAESEKNLKARFNNLKQHGYIPSEFDWDEFSKNLEAGIVPKVTGKETSKLYDDLLTEYRSLSGLREKSENLAAEADKQYGLEVKSDTAAAAQADFAKRSHEFFGFPSLNLYSAQKGIRNDSGHNAGEGTNSYIRGIGKEPEPAETSTTPADGTADFNFVRTFDFSKATPESVKRLQGIVGTTPDGVVGPKTRSAYRKFLGLPEDNSSSNSTKAPTQARAKGAVAYKTNEETPLTSAEKEAQALWLNANKKYDIGKSDNLRDFNTHDAKKSSISNYEVSANEYEELNGKIGKEEMSPTVAMGFNSARPRRGSNTNANFQKIDPRLRQWTTQDLQSLIIGNSGNNEVKAGWVSQANNRTKATVLRWFNDLRDLVEKGAPELEIKEKANEYLKVQGVPPTSKSEELSKYLQGFDDINVYTDLNGQPQLVLIPVGYRLVDKKDANGNVYPYMERK